MIALIFITGCSQETVINRGSNLGVGYDDLRFPALNLARGVSSPDTIPFIGNTEINAFDDSIDQELFLSIQMPHSWLEGSNIMPHFHYSPLTNNSGIVVWCLDYTWANIGDKFPATKTECINGNVTQEQYYHKMTPMINISGINKTASSMLEIRIYRDANNPTDNLTGDVGLNEFDVHYIKYRLGEPY